MKRLGRKRWRNCTRGANFKGEMNQMVLFLREQKGRRPILLRTLRLFAIGLAFFLLPLLLRLLVPLLPIHERTNVPVFLSIFQYMTILPALAYWALALSTPLERTRNRVLLNALRSSRLLDEKRARLRASRLSKRLRRKAIREGWGFRIL